MLQIRISLVTNRKTSFDISIFHPFFGDYSYRCVNRSQWRHCFNGNKRGTLAAIVFLFFHSLNSLIVPTIPNDRSYETIKFIEIAETIFDNKTIIFHWWHNSLHRQYVFNFNLGNLIHSLVSLQILKICSKFRL